MVEAVDEGDGSFLGDFGFDVASNRSGAQHTEVLSLETAVLVCLDGCDQQVVPGWDFIYF
jgi:hypothetical protein